MAGNDRRRRARALRRGGDAYLIATVLPAAIGIGYGLGWGLDRLFGTAPWLAYGFTGLGVAAGLMEAVRIALRVGREEDAAAQAETPPEPGGPQGPEDVR